jgi:probable HAF family extracellular repeat protein
VFTESQARDKRTVRGRQRSISAVISTLAGLILGQAPADAQNLLTDLGPGTAFGLNNGAQVVLQNGIYANGIVTPFPAGFTGDAINSSGQVAGALTATNIIGSAAFYSNGTVTYIGANADPDVAFSSALGINDNGVVVGQGAGTGGTYRYAFIYKNGTLTIVPPFPGSVALGAAQAVGINDGGLVVGTMFNAAPVPATTDAFIYNSNTAVLTDLGPGSAFAINASGQVVGSNAAGNCIFSNGTTTPIPIPGVAINATGQVVGGKFFYSGGTIDLNALVSATDPLKPYVTLTDAVGINDALLIAVNGVDSRTQLTHAYLIQAPWITASPGPLTFQSQTVGTVSSAQVETITNGGTTPLAVDGISTSSNFLQTNNCGPSLPPSGTCAVRVTFSPAAAGDLTGGLTVTSTGVPVVVPLAGTAPIKVAISSNTASLTAGTPVKLSWTASPGATCTATGGSSADGWTGEVALSGTQSVAESSAGGYQYGLSCTAGSQSASGQVSVVVNWPALTVSLTASPTTIASGQSTTLTWTSANATACIASGGGTDDGWTGTARATSGSAAITEAVVVASPLSLTFTLTCDNASTGQSTPASIKVALNPTPSSSGGGSGGGGTLDPFSWVVLLCILALRRLGQGKQDELLRVIERHDRQITRIQGQRPRAQRMRCSRWGNRAAEAIAVARPRPHGMPAEESALICRSGSPETRGGFSSQRAAGARPSARARPHRRTPRRRPPPASVHGAAGAQVAIATLRNAEAIQLAESVPQAAG